MSREWTCRKTSLHRHGAHTGPSAYVTPNPQQANPLGALNLLEPRKGIPHAPKSTPTPHTPCTLEHGRSGATAAVSPWVSQTVQRSFWSGLAYASVFVLVLMVFRQLLRGPPRLRGIQPLPCFPVPVCCCMTAHCNMSRPITHIADTNATPGHAVGWLGCATQLIKYFRKTKCSANSDVMCDNRTLGSASRMTDCHPMSSVTKPNPHIYQNLNISAAWFFFWEAASERCCRAGGSLECWSVVDNDSGDMVRASARGAAAGSEWCSRLTPVRMELA